MFEVQRMARAHGSRYSNTRMVAQGKEIHLVSTQLLGGGHSYSRLYDTDPARDFESISIVCCLNSEPDSNPLDTGQKIGIHRSGAPR